MFTTVGQVERALGAFREYYQPKASSLVMVSNKTRDIDADPFRRGFLDALQLRTELLGRLSSLDERERAVLLLWYVEDLSVAQVCERMQLSRSHCYRIRDKALAEMIDDEPTMEIAEAYA